MNHLFNLNKDDAATSIKAKNTSQKLQERKVNPYRIVQGQLKTVMFEKDDILDTVSIDRIMIAQRRSDTFPPFPTAHERDRTDAVIQTRAAAHANEHIGKEDEIDNDHPGPEKRNADKYVVDRVDDLSVKRGQPLYRVQWYGYSPDGDTLKLAEKSTKLLHPTILEHSKSVSA